MKRNLAILLAGILLFTATGCGSDPVETPETSVTVEDSTEETVTEASESSEEAAPAVSEEAEFADELYLRELFAEHGMKVGTCLTTRMTSNKEMSKLITEQFSSITMENDMKPDYLFNKKESQSKGDLVVEFSKNMITMLDWAKANDMAVRGHTLVWYSQTPGWIFHEDFNLTKPLASREVMLARMESYIRQVFALLEEKGYSDIIYAYDVVNEAWMEDGQMRKEHNLWYETIGDDYLWYAFYYANKYAPENIDLFYNDYNEQFKTDTLVKFVDTLKDDDGNYLIDGVGFQAHLYTSDNLDSYFRTMDKVAATGLKIQLTELDVCLGAYQNIKPANDANLKAQGKFYYNLIHGIFERVDNGTLDSNALTFWGFADNMSWRKEYSPLLYDSKTKPKYAYYGAMQVKDQAGF